MCTKSISIGITGGIGSGKSYVCQLLEKRGIPVFYTDIEARREMLTNPILQQQLEKLIDAPILLSNGELNKNGIGGYISKGNEYAQKVNQLVHPVLKRRMEQWIVSNNSPLVVVECALLFESGFADSVDYSLMVQAPEAVRVARTMDRDNRPEEYVRRIMVLQMSENEKSQRCQFKIVNDGVQNVETQIDNLLDFLKQRIGDAQT